MTNVTDRLTKAIKEKKSLVCVGLDPRIKQIPDHIKKRALREFGNTPEAVASAIVDFNTLIIKNTVDVTVAYKPQIALYEQYGPAGLRAFKRTVDYAKDQGAIVIGDGKRNDIGSTTDAYADGHIGKVKLIDGPEVPSLDVDILTVNPYLGTDTIKSFLKYCDEKGIFVLCRTSNESAADLQDRLVDLYTNEIDLINERLEGTGLSRLSLMDLPVMKKTAEEMRQESVDVKKLEGKAPVYVVIAMLIDEWGKDFVGDSRYSSVGAVVGATYPEEANVLRRIMPKTCFLVPGYGAQGGKGEDIPNFVDDCGLGAIVNSARGIIFAYMKDPYKSRFKPEQFADAAREAAIATRDDIAEALKKANKWID